jgi:hypothetical protein
MLCTLSGVPPLLTRAPRGAAARFSTRGCLSLETNQGTHLSRARSRISCSSPFLASPCHQL